MLTNICQLNKVLQLASEPTPLSCSEVERFQKHFTDFSFRFSRSMSHDINAIEKTLRCSFCAERFSDTIKLIPDCGNSICGNCFDNLKSSQSGRFQCLACQAYHTLKNGDMPDNLALKQLLDHNKDKLDEHARILMPLIAEMQEKVSTLKVSLDDDENVNKCCDELKAEVEEAFQKAFEHLISLKDDLLDEISSYRQKGAKQLYASDDQSIRIKKQLTELSDEIVDYGQQWGNYFKRKDKVAGKDELDEAQREAKEYSFRMAQIEKKIKSKASNKPIEFKANGLFAIGYDHLGELVDRSKQSKGSFSNDSFGLYQLTIQKLFNPFGLDGKIDQDALSSLKLLSDPVSQVVFLPNGNLVACTKSSAIKLCKYENGRATIEDLVGHSKSVNSICLLTNGWLASASDDTTIKVWDLNEKRLLRTLRGHTDTVFALKPLPDSCIASCSWDDTLRIWCPYQADGKNLLMTMQGHGIKAYTFAIDTLSNGYLMTCSDSECVLRVWNPKSGKLVKSIETELYAACAFTVLSNDDAAIGLDDGSINIIDLVDSAKPMRLENCHREGVCSLVELASELLLSAGFWQDPTIKLWNLRDGKLLQTIATGQTHDIRSLCLSPYGKHLASGSSDKTIKIWSVQVNHN